MKPGYKQTDVGVIPEEWEVLPFGEIAHIERGKFTARPRNDPRFYGGEIPFIQTGDVTNADGHITTYSQTLNSEGLKVSKLFQRGTLFFTIAANIGDVGFATFDAACPDSLVAITPTRDTDKRWLAYELAKRKASFESIATHNAQLNINLEKLRPYLLPHPPLPEQRAIAEALSDVDALLGGLDRLITKKRDLKQAAMQQLLTGQTRLPGFHGEWPEKRLGDVGEFSKGRGIKKDEVVSHGLPCVRYGEIYTHHDDCVRVFNSFITPGTAKQSQRIQKGDLLFAGSGETAEEIGKCVAFLGDEEAYAGGDIVIFRPVAQDSMFLGYLMNHSSVASQKASMGQGDAVVHISARNLARLKLHLPTTREQTAIAAVLSDMDAELAALEQRRAKTRALKQGMMQELLTGRTRLVSPVTNVVPFPKPTQPAAAKAPAHNWQINEAVIIGALACQFGTEVWPLPRKRRVKLTYLLHRHVEGRAEGYLKKAAGPYNPGTKYKGPEGIALKNGYVREHNNGKYAGFVAAGNVAQAQAYFAEWYPGAAKWMEQFRFEKTDELELLATVDMAMDDLRSSGQAVDLAAVKGVIRDHPEWEAKLTRPIFSDANIARAISTCEHLMAPA